MKKRWRDIRRKLSGDAGESISETLVALLIGALALVMLAGAISAGSNAIARGRQKLEKYYALNESVARRESVTDEHFKTGADTIRIAESAAGELDKLQLEGQAVVYYENDEFAKAPVVSYKK